MEHLRAGNVGRAAKHPLIFNHEKHEKREYHFVLFVLCQLIAGIFSVKSRAICVDKRCMASAISAASMLTSIPNQKTMMEAAVAVLKRSNDAAKQEGEALVQLIENSSPQANERLLDTHA